MIRRLTRSTLHREDNSAQAAGYGRALRAVFDDWLEHSKLAGLSVRSLAGRLQQAAEAHYQAAYLRGKRQAYPMASLDAQDRLWIARALQENRGIVERSLAADILDKATLQRMQGGDLEELRRTFGARVEQQYGGQLWRVTEAGFGAGVRDLAAALRIRFRLPLQQEDGQDDEAAIAALALLLGLSVARIRRALARAQITRPAPGGEATITVTARVADLATATSPTTATAAAALGVTPAALADAASAAAQEAVGGLPSEDAALAQAMGEDNLIELGTRARTRGIRMGVEYECENDSSTCADCRSYAGGGEGGIYWEPDEPPLPGSGRCGGNCRCILAAVYELRGSEAA